MKVARMLVILAVAAVLAWGLPATAYAATISAYNPDDYTSDVKITGDEQNITFDFSELTPIVYVWKDCTSPYGDVTHTEIYRNESVNIYPVSNCFTLRLCAYPFGSYAEPDAGAPQNGGLLDVSELCAGNPITFHTSYTLEITADNLASSGAAEELTVNCDFGIYKYDVDGAYLGVSYLGAVTESFSEADSTWQYVAQNDWYCENDVAYILPFCYFSAEKQDLSTWNVNLTEGDFTLSVGINMIYEQLQTLDEINQSIHANGVNLQSAISDAAHADLFGAFLICGTLIGIALFRRLFK